MVEWRAFVVSKPTFQIKSCARSPIDKRFWYTHVCEKFLLWRHCPSGVHTSGERKVPWRCVTLENVFGLDWYKNNYQSKLLWNVTLNLCGNPRFFGGKWDGLLLLKKQTRILKNTNFFWFLVFVEYVVKLHMLRKQATNKQIWNPRATNKQAKCQLKTNMWWAGWVSNSHRN